MIALIRVLEVEVSEVDGVKRILQGKNQYNLVVGLRQKDFLGLFFVCLFCITNQ